MTQENALERDIFNIPVPNFETAKKVSSTAKKYGINVHDLEQKLGIVKCDPRTFEERHPKVVARAKEARKTVQEVKKMPSVGDRHSINSYSLECAQVKDSTVVWEVLAGGTTAGYIKMAQDCSWSHNLSKQSFSTPYEAIASLHECNAAREQRSEEVEVLEVHGDEFVVLSNDNYYVVRPNHPDPKERCECGDAHYRGANCKHQRKVVKQFSDALPPGVQQAAKNTKVTAVMRRTEIDSVDDDVFGTLYRVWEETRLLGTFYENLQGNWVSQPCNASLPGEWVTDVEAVSAILAA